MRTDEIERCINLCDRFNCDPGEALKQLAELRSLAAEVERLQRGQESLAKTVKHWLDEAAALRAESGRLRIELSRIAAMELQHGESGELKMRQIARAALAPEAGKETKS